MTISLVAAPRTRRRRDLAVAVVSAFVLLLVAGYFVAPDQEALGLSPVVVSRISGHDEVVYGKISKSNGSGEKGFAVAVYERISKHHHTKYSLVGHAKTSGKGIYRIVEHKPRGTYRVTVTGTISGKKRTATKSLSLRPGRAYRVNGRVTNHRTFVFLPVSSY